MVSSVFISFEGKTTAEANKYAASLALAVHDSDRRATTERRKENPDSQDEGAILGLILGSAAVGTVAKGVASWLARNAGTRIRIHTADGTWVNVDNASGQDTARIVQAALTKH